jgi:hypothetical protein
MQEEESNQEACGSSNGLDLGSSGTWTSIVLNRSSRLERATRWLGS